MAEDSGKVSNKAITSVAHENEVSTSGLSAPQKSINRLLRELSKTIHNIPYEERLYWIEFCEKHLRSSIPYNPNSQTSTNKESVPPPQFTLPILIKSEPLEDTHESLQRPAKRQKRQRTDTQPDGLIPPMANATESSSQSNIPTRGRHTRETTPSTLPRLQCHDVAQNSKHVASALIDDTSDSDKLASEEHDRQLGQPVANSTQNLSDRQLARIRAQKPLQRIRKIKSSNEWYQIDRSMTVALNPIKLSQLRVQFQVELLKLKGTAKHGNKLPTLQSYHGESDNVDRSSKLFSKTEAAQMTAYFFEITMGEPALQQIIDFVANYDCDPTTGLDKGANARFTSLAGNKALPNGVRNFFAACLNDRTLRAEDGAVAKNNDETVMAHIREILQSLNFARQYKNACKDIEERSTAIWEYLEKERSPEEVKKLKDKLHTTTRRGVSKASIAKDLLAEVGKIKRNILQSQVDHIQTIKIVLDKFGEAFLLVMCPSSSSFLRNLGTARVEAACTILLRLCPSITQVVEVLDAIIWQPFKRGDERLNIDIARMKADAPDQPFLDVLQSGATVDLDQ